MLHVITNLNDPYLDLLRDDPVRPDIPTALRVHDHAVVFVLLRESSAAAVTCVRFLDHVPESVEDLQGDTESVAVFYTIWSYQRGAGRELISSARSWIEQNRISVDRFVTLSPKTDIARRFHLSNGAVTLRENALTVNYEYL